MARSIGKKGKWIIAVLFALVLIIVSLYSLSYYNDRINNKCAYVPADQRDACCAASQNNTVSFDCGSNGWKFDSSLGRCAYTCTLGSSNESSNSSLSAPVQNKFCAADVKQCSDGSYVSRDPNNGCNFKACP